MNLSAEKLLEIINQLLKEHNMLKNEFTRIQKIENTLEGHAYWEGDASNYYTKKLKDIITQFEDINKSMSDSIKYLESIINNYGSLGQTVTAKGSNVIK